MSIYSKLTQTMGRTVTLTALAGGLVLANPALAEDCSLEQVKMEMAAEAYVDKMMRILTFVVAANIHKYKAPGPVVLTWEIAEGWSADAMKWLLENEAWEGGTAGIYPAAEEKKDFYAAKEAFLDCIEDMDPPDDDVDPPHAPPTTDDGSLGCLECTGWDTEEIEGQFYYDEEKDEYVVTSGIEITVCTDWTYDFNGVDSSGDGFCD